MSKLTLFGSNAAKRTDNLQNKTQANTDPLTGLYSREHILKLLPTLLSRPAEDGVRALVYVRPDRFGEIDERLGPTASDALLQKLAARLKAQLASKCLVSRFSGTGFLALVSRSETADIRSLAESIREDISAKLFEIGAESTSMTVSIGVLVLPRIPKSAEQSITMAQAANRIARQGSGDAVHIDEPDDEEYKQDAEASRWARRTSEALKSDRFRLLYQPIAKLDGSNSFSFDVLIRMIAEDGKEVPPGDFLSAANHAGLMPEIDRWVIKNAFKVAAARHAKGKKTRIFVRLSEDTLRDSHFTGWLGLEALKHRLDLDSVVLQIPEEVIERRLPAVRELSAICGDIHLKLSMASSGEQLRYLNLVRELKLDFLVLDGSQGGHLDSPQLEQMIIAVKENNTRVIASRVEGAAQMSRLYQLGVDYVTGFYVHEPGQDMADDVHLTGVTE